MREIKFRAWDEIHMEMISDAHKFLWDADRGIGFIPMQYTGLHDKNGKEIYEGDIVLIVDRTGLEETTKASIRWSDSLAAFVPHPAQYYDIEVIGDIHQHPDLPNPPKE